MANDGCLDVLRKLEADNDVRILYAADAGSRAWGWASSDSDLDIRFIYMHNDRKKYLSLNGVKKQTIDGFSEDRHFDWQGWDVSKALLHLQQTNPSIVEWLESPIVYLQADLEAISIFKELLQCNFRYTPLLHHYRSMAKGQFMEYVAKKSKVNVKKYLCAVRPAAMVEWLAIKYNQKEVQKFKVDFRDVWQDLKAVISPQLQLCVERLIELKIEGKTTEIDANEELNQWLLEIVDRKRQDLRDFENLLKESEAGKPTMDQFDEAYIRLLGFCA